MCSIEARDSCDLPFADLKLEDAFEPLKDAIRNALMGDVAHATAYLPSNLALTEPLSMCKSTGHLRRKLTDGKKRSDWFGKVEQSGISELARFVNGLRDDEAAVHASMEYAWSNGQMGGRSIA